MSAVTTVTMISFRGRPIPTVKDAAGVVRVALRPIVEAMGLDWSAQTRRLRRDQVLSEGVAIMATPSGYGDHGTGEKAGR
ncbi:MAG: phage antirepressor N-terminal domain-containing protein [Sphingomonadales bacterium]